MTYDTMTVGCRVRQDPNHFIIAGSFGDLGNDCNHDDIVELVLEAGLELADVELIQWETFEGAIASDTITTLTMGLNSCRSYYGDDGGDETVFARLFREERAKRYRDAGIEDEDDEEEG